MSLFCVKIIEKSKRTKTSSKINRGEFDRNSDFNQQKRWKTSKLKKQKHVLCLTSHPLTHTLHFPHLGLSSPPSLLSALRNGQWILEDLKNFGF